jgi:hypothetical protein
VAPAIVNNNDLQWEPVDGTLGSFLQNWQLRARCHEKIRRQRRANTFFKSIRFMA